MSKMPAKKKSCFQITSVTQAQVAASSITDDTESLDDPDESRTEDVSSEIFDGSRGDQGVCDRSSSEETLNNVGDHPEGQLPITAPVNGGLSYKGLGSVHVTPHNLGGSVSVPAKAQPFVPTHPLTVINTVPAASVSTNVTHTTPAISSCSSRFRVIKLDHGTGEPFRRGRWTCTEFYDKDSDSSVNRTVDSIKPTVTPEHTVERDSGLGATINSAVTGNAFSSHTLENSADSGYSVGHPTHPHPSEPLHPGYSLAPQFGSRASAFQPTGYLTEVSQQPQQSVQPVVPQTFPPNSINGVQQGSTPQKSHVLPPPSQPQQIGYSAHNTGLSAGQLDYSQQQFGSGTLPMGSLPVGPSANQVPLPLINPIGLGTQQHGEEAASAQGVLLNSCNVSQPQPSGGSGLGSAPSITTTSHSSVQNVPATVPIITNTPLGVLGQVPGSGGLVQPQGAHGGATTSLSSGHSSQAEDSRQKPDALPQPSASVLPQKDVTPFFGEGLNLDIDIGMDGDEDSASGASVVAIDNKIEQAMDLVKSHLMYAVREEVEVLKEQIKELYERNSVLERENAVLKSLANSEQLGQLSSQLSQASSTSPPLLLQQQHSLITNTTPLTQHEGSQSIPHQPNMSSA